MEDFFQLEEDFMTHVHEILGSVDVAENHAHRFATVSGEVISVGEDHYHEVIFRTDFQDNHFHDFLGDTSGAIDVGNGSHIHVLNSVTTEDDGHRHSFKTITFMDNM